MPSIQYSKRRWSNVLWWTVLILVGVYILMSRIAPRKPEDTDSAESQPEVKDKRPVAEAALSEDEKDLRKKDETVNKKRAEAATVPKETENPIELEKEQEETAEPKPVTRKKTWNIPKPKVTEDSTWILTPKMDQCSKTDATQRPLLLVIVMTTADNVAHRNAIRESWGYPVNSHTNHIHTRADLFRVVFVMGNAQGNLEQEVEEEARENGDVFQLGFKDSVYEFTRKMVNVLKWMHREPHFKTECRPQFVLKVLDNVYINFPALVHWLEKKYPADPSTKAAPVYTGHLVHHDEPIREVDHPLYTSREDYPETHYPDFIRSPVYLFSWSAIVGLANQIANVRPLPMEDAYLGLLAVKAGVYPTHNEHFVLIGQPTNVCHHLRMFFIGGVMPMEHIRIFRRHAHARTLPECDGMLSYQEEDKQDL